MSTFSVADQCVELGIPDDVAGATFMAAGASSPELFASIMSLFITHSPLGTGTIIGSEIFNHLIICAGSVLYSKTGCIQLEPRIVFREITFYAIALGMLLWALNTTSSNNGGCRGKLTNDQISLRASDDTEYICVEWYKGLALVGGYVVYALVCSFYGQILALFCAPEEDAHNGRLSVADAGAFLDGDDRLRRSLAGEHPGNFQTHGGSGAAPAEPSEAGAMQDQRNPITGNPKQWDKGNEQQEKAKEGSNLRLGDGVSNSTVGTVKTVMFTDVDVSDDGPQRRPSRLDMSMAFAMETRRSITRTASGGMKETMRSVLPMYIFTGATVDLYETDIDEELGQFSCWAWKKSKFYSKIPNNAKAWQLRWLTVHKLGLRTEKCRLGSAQQKGVRALNIYEATGVELFDANRFIIKLSIPTSGDLFFQAPSQAIASGLQRALAKQIDVYYGLALHSRKKMRRASLKATGNNATDMTSEVFAEALAKKEAAQQQPALRVGDNLGSIQVGGSSLTSDAVMHHDEDEDIEGLMDWPTGAGAVAAHLILLPLKAAL
jgi:hypothetical protein